ncbi:MAG: FkbM family methyltransferase [Gemmatimonadaceae bacterium]
MLREIARALWRAAYVASHPTGTTVLLGAEPIRVSARVARGLPRMIDSPIFETWLSLASNAFCLIDAGANIGIWSVAAARRMRPGGQIFAFEPAPETFRLLQDMARVAQGPGRVTPVESALGKDEGQTQLVLGDDSTTNHIGDRGVAVPLTTLDAFCETNRIQPSAIKIDVEGAELDVLRGGAGLLAMHGPTIALELHNRPQMGATPELLLPLLSELNYQAVAPNGDALTTPAAMYGNPAMLLRPR